MTLKQSTLAIRSGLNDDNQYGAVIPPIYLSTTFNFPEFNAPRVHDYARRGNPSRDHVLQTIAQLEGGHSAVITSSGTSALHLLTTVLLGPKDTIIAPIDCYGGSYRLLNSLYEKGAYTVVFINQNDEIALTQALSLKPKLVLIETPSNPLLNIVDIAKISNAAHEIGAFVLVDNTFMSPVLQQPFELGADFILHSCSKFLNGHSDIVAGAIVTKTQEMTETLTWWANNIGVTHGAFDCYLLLRGLRTLVPRVKQQQNTAQGIVNFLQNHPQIEKLYYPGLASHPGHAVAEKQQLGFGALISFELKGNQNQVANFVNALQLFTLAESLGGVETLISHPITMTHAGMSTEAQVAAGLTPQLLRVSVGLEDEADLIADLTQAFNVAQHTP